MRFARVNKLPSLLRQETTASLQLLRLLLRMYASAPAPGSEGGAESLRASAQRHLEPLAASMVARYTRLAVAAEHARTAATPAFMHAASHFAGGAEGQQQQQTTYDAAALAGRSEPAAPALAPGSGFASYYPAVPAPAPAAAGAAADSALALDVRELFRETAAYGPLVLTLLGGVLAWDDARFRDNLGWLYPLLTGLVVAGSLEVRSLVAGVFERRLASMLPLPPTAELGSNDAAE
jgi:hypothetical protein